MSLVSDKPIVNRKGDLCGLCDSSHGHEHPTLKCSECGISGLSENMKKHVCLGLKYQKMLSQITLLTHALQKAQEFLNEAAAYGSCDCSEESDNQCIHCETIHLNRHFKAVLKISREEMEAL